MQASRGREREICHYAYIRSGELNSEDVDVVLCSYKYILINRQAHAKGMLHHYCLENAVVEKEAIRPGELRGCYYFCV